MAVKTAADLKAYFETGDVPTQAQFVDLIDTIFTGISNYKIYTAILNQTGTGDPVATVLENTLGGTLVWTRDGVGEYLATLNGLFLENKVLILITANEGNQIIGGSRNSDNDVYLSKKDLATGVYTDSLISINIEIRVYN